MDPATRQRLVDYYRPWNAALRAEFDLDVDWDR
jgi:hypothetical protein